MIFTGSQQFPQFQAKSELKTLITSYYKDLQQIQKDKKKKIAWVSSMAPVEILRAFGFELFFPENHAAIIGARKLENAYIEKTIRTTGFNESGCSYMLSDIGANLLKTSPLKYFDLPPEPDLIVYNTNQCLEVKHWLTYYARFYNVPIFGIETPHTIEKSNKLVVEFVSDQLIKLINDIEKLFKFKLKDEKLTEVIESSRHCSFLWQQILEFNKTTPALTTFFDRCNFMAPAVLFRGDRKTEDFYKSLLEELEHRSENNIYPVKNEQYRLIWCGLPVWGGLKYLSNLFYSLNTSLVNSVYESSWVFNLDPDDPVTSMARVYSELFINLTEDEKGKYLYKLVTDWSASGIIFHHSLSCKRNSDNHYGLAKKLKDNYQIPSITFEADHNNLKSFSQKRFSTLIEALLEQIRQKQKICNRS